MYFMGEQAMNVLMLLKNKSEVAFVYDTNTLRQGIEKMHAHGYSAIPALSKDGTYVGSVSEGDFLWHILEYRNNDLRVQENYQVSDILRKDFNPAVKIDVSMDELLERSMNQNFIPVVDDRNFFIGIVTRQDIIRSILKEL